MLDMADLSRYEMEEAISRGVQRAISRMFSIAEFEEIVSNAIERAYRNHLMTAEFSDGSGTHSNIVEWMSLSNVLAEAQQDRNNPS